MNEKIRKRKKKAVKMERERKLNNQGNIKERKNEKKKMNE